jgi:hypothetical protein
MADNKRKTQEILELEIQVKEQEANRSLKNIIKTSEELTKTSILGNRENKKVVDALIKSVKTIGGEYGKASERYRNALTSTQKAFDESLDGQKSALRLQVKRMQKSENEIKRTRDLVLAADAIEDALKQQVKVKSDLIANDEEREKFLKTELDKVEQQVSLRKKEAISLRGNRQALKEMTRETAAIRANTLDTAKATRVTRFANQAGRAVSAGGRGVLNTVDSFRSGYSRAGLENLVKGIQGANSKFGGAMKNAGRALSASDSPVLQAAGKLTGVFSSLSKAVATATRFLGWFASAVMLAIEADEKQKEMNKALSRGLGSAGIKSGDLKKLGDYITNTSISQGPLASSTLRLNSEELREATNALMTGGVNLKTLSNGYQGLESVIETTAIASRNFGIEMSDSAKMVGEYFEAFGSGSEKIKDIFSTLNKDIKMSGMTTNQFLSTIQSVSAQFNIFVDQTKEFSGVLGKISKGGALTGKQLNKLVGSLAGFGPKTVDEGIKAMALYGTQIKKQAAIERESVEKRLEEGKYGTEAERYQDQRRLESLRVVEKGGLNAGVALQDAMGSMGMIGAFLEKRGISDFKQMRAARNDAESVKMMAGISGMSDNEVRDLLEATSALMENTDQTFSQLLQNNRKELQQKIGAETARREAEEIASNTITKLSGLQDVGNAILFKIADLIQKVYNIMTEIGASLVKNVNPLNWFKKDEGKLIDTEGLKKGVAEAFPDAKGAQQALSAGETAVQTARITENMALNLGINNKPIVKASKKTKPTKIQAPKTNVQGATAPTPGSTTASQTLPKVPDKATAPQTATATGHQINMSAVLQLPNNQPIKLVVKEVLYEMDKKL